MNRTICLIALMGTLMAGACASTLTDEEIYAREDARLLERDRIRQFIADCELSNGVVILTNRNATRTRRDEIPRHARLIDYQCGNLRSTRRALGGM